MTQHDCPSGQSLFSSHARVLVAAGGHLLAQVLVPEVGSTQQSRPVPLSQDRPKQSIDAGVGTSAPSGAASVTSASSPASVPGGVAASKEVHAAAAPRSNDAIPMLVLAVVVASRLHFFWVVFRTRVTTGDSSGAVHFSVYSFILSEA